MLSLCINLPEGIYDYETIHTIVNTATVLHVSFTPTTDDPFPTILPMLGALGSFGSPTIPLSDGPLDLYLHGYVSSRLVRIAQPSAADSATSTATPHGLPVAVAATHVDGYVLALTPMHHSMNYRSAVLHGYASAVTDPAERLYAMELITESAVPGRWANTRVPPTSAELTSTGILKVRIESASAKVRAGMPAEDRKDEKDEAVRDRVWSGVVPIWEAKGQPVAAAKNRVELPRYLTEWIDEANREAEQGAVGAAAERE